MEFGKPGEAQEESCVPTCEGRACLRPAGRRLGYRRTAERRFPIAALLCAAVSSGRLTAGTVVYTDRGVQRTCATFRRKLERMGARQCVYWLVSGLCAGRVAFRQSEVLNRLTGLAHTPRHRARYRPVDRHVLQHRTAALGNRLPHAAQADLHSELARRPQPLKVLMSLNRTLPPTKRLRDAALQGVAARARYPESHSHPLSPPSCGLSHASSPVPLLDQRQRCQYRPVTLVSMSRRSGRAVRLA